MKTNDDPHPRDALVFAGYTLDFAAQLLRDAAGEVVPMRAQAWSVLQLLARHAGNLVTKDQLFDAVWPGLVVTEGSLTQAISDVRQTLGPAGHQIVRTMPRRGYMLVAEPVEADAAEVGLTSNLPAAPQPLFGREQELAELFELLSAHRLVTVVGTGGIGKTAFALAGARRWQGAGWVELAPLADPALIPAAIAQALALPIANAADPLPGLLAALRPLRGLVVLDNAEHLIDAVAGIVRMALDHAPGLHLLVTSQAPLRIDGEHVFRLGALDLPAPDATWDDAARCGAVALFVDRAQAVDRRFELNSANVAAVVRLCNRLDGLPLAIRLAAARLQLLGLQGLEARLDERLRLLAGGSRDAPPRQQTLLAALDWSYGLLAPDEQALFRRLGVFVGGFTLELAIAAFADAAHDDASLIDSLGQLVDRSLVSADGGDPPRYRLLESARAYAVQRLGGERDAAQMCHALAMARLMQAGSDQHWMTPDDEWLPRWTPELDNLRAALEWSMSHDPRLFVTLASSCAGLFRLLDVSEELRRRIETVERAGLPALDAEMTLRHHLACAYLQAGIASAPMNDHAVRAESIARSLNEDRWLYIALTLRAMSTLVRQEERAALLAEIMRLEPRNGSPRQRAQRWGAEYCLRALDDEWPQALHAAETGLTLAFEAGSSQLKPAFANWQLVALIGLGRVDEALQRSIELQGIVPVGRSSLAIPFLGTSARCALQTGDVDGAKRQLATMFERCRTVAWHNFRFFGDLYPHVPLAEGRFDAAARLLGYAKAARQQAWSSRQSTRLQDEARTVLAATMDPARLALLMAEGESLDEEAVCLLVVPGAAVSHPSTLLRMNLAP